MRFFIVVGVIVAVFAAGSWSSAIAQEPSESNEQVQLEFFESKIRPVLVQHCYECHSADAKNIKGGLLLDTRVATLKGGDSGPAVVAKNIDDSLLINALRYGSFEMPPKGKLPEAVIADFVTWVEMGAPDPREGDTAAVAKINYEEARQFWSYQPIAHPDVPKVQQADWPRNEVDHFTLAKMEQLGLHPVPPAGKAELIRRATFDLIGLPPTPEEVAAFVADDSPEAFANVIDRLLSSPHYGERWGRYWLDVARYAEDQAHTFSVTANTNGYRYRDWVVSAFNSDTPYNQFVKLQIAGDLIDGQTRDSYDNLIALGFFGLGAQYYKNSDAAKAAADELDDRVDTLTRGFLGLTVSCARCHDHKFDPIPTQDYYSLAGIFNSSKLHNAPLCKSEDIEAYNAGQQRIKTTEEAVKTFLADENSTAAESRVGEISKYMEAVWKYRVASTSGQSPNTAEFAKQADISEFLFKRWISFLDSKEKGKVSALDPWFALDSKEAVPAEDVSKVATEFQQRIQELLDVRDGVVTSNLVQADENEPHKPGSPLFVTPLVTKIRPIAGIDVDIRNAKQLFLVVSEGGNGNSCDHSDWLEPRLTGPAGELKLTDLKWTSLEGFGGARIDRNYEGKRIQVGGKKYSYGIGTHAPSVIVYDLPEGYERFKAIGGLDNSGSDQGGCGEQASVQFSVYTEKPVDGPVGVGEDLLTKVLGNDGPLAVGNDDLEKFLTGEKKEQLTKLRAEHDEAKKTAPPMYPIAHSYAEANAADMKVFVRGNPANQREVAPRRFLTVLAGEDQSVFTDGSGRRELAEAIASDENPLTARVMVNRIWQHHFGRGIVGTPSNFGTQGEAPTHPELLDYLAAKFLKSGWSIKSLHREIMLSSTYQLSSTFSESNANIDGDNRFLWKMSRRRLDVEAWRDALLDVSGKLDRTLGGPSTNLAEANNVRRTIYAKVSRHELDSLLRLFDFPDANITSEKRSETTVPQQQLFVLNSPFMVEQAKAFSARVHKEAADNDEARIRHAFLLAYSRPVTDPELELGLTYLSIQSNERNKLTRWEQYAQVLLGSNEFMYLD
jgi:mono/diheme cytochrome c family protein/cytochrome c553